MTVSSVVLHSLFFQPTPSIGSTMKQSEIKAELDRVYGKNIYKMGAWICFNIIQSDDKEHSPESITLMLEQYSTRSLFELDTFLHEHSPNMWPVPFDNSIHGTGEPSGHFIKHILSDDITVYHRVVGRSSHDKYITRIAEVHVVDFNGGGGKILDASGRDIEKDCSS